MDDFKKLLGSQNINQIFKEAVMLEPIPGHSKWLEPPTENQVCIDCFCHVDNPDLDCKESEACECHRLEREAKERRIRNMDLGHIDKEDGE